ncbi:MAG TPA: polysaccharide deacetylase family protein [Syntrophales bacterium]|nr:polysaccharide deacetylase family protein [Syntrophales bacterium]
MPSIVLCLHAHLPLRLKKYGFFDIGHSADYFDAEQSRRVLERSVKDSYLPANEAMLKLIRRHRGGFRVSCSISGMLLEQLEAGQKAMLDSFRRLADTGCVEFLCGPWYHSLASVFSEEEFRKQIILHKRKIRALFGQMPRAFRNTELLYGNDVARIAESMGFRVILAGGAGRIPGCETEVLHRPAGCRRIQVLFRNDRLSDEVVPRPLGADEIIRVWIDGHRGDEVINLFINYEAFIGCGGMTDFLGTLAGVLRKQRNVRFSTPSEAAAEHEPAGQIDASDLVFHAGPEREGSAWLGNHMQIDAARTLYRLEDRVRATKSRKWIGVWRNLQASDYFLDMRTEERLDRTVHRVVSSFESPYDAYIYYMSILRDFSGRIAGKVGVRP